MKGADYKHPSLKRHLGFAIFLGIFILCAQGACSRKSSSEQASGEDTPPERPDKAHLEQAHKDVRSIAPAFRAYETEYGRRLEGSTVEKMRILLAIDLEKNPRRIQFIAAEPRQIVDGQLLDPWGSPYEIDLSAGALPRVHSFGPNKLDEGGIEGSDDIVSWR